MKELRLRPAADDHDAQTKIKERETLPGRGRQGEDIGAVQGREMAHQELGRKLMDKIVAEIGALAVLDQRPKFEGRSLTVILAPQAKG